MLTSKEKHAKMKPIKYRGGHPKMKEIVLSELSIEQKIGQLLVVRKIHDEEDRQFIYQMLENCILYVVIYL